MLMIGVIFIMVLLGYYVVNVKQIFHKPATINDVEEEKEGLRTAITEMERIKGENTSSKYIDDAVDKAQKERENAEKKSKEEKNAEEMEKSKEPNKTAILAPKKDPNLIESLKCIKACEEAIKVGNKRIAQQHYIQLRKLYLKIPQQYKRRVYIKSKELHKNITALELFELK